MKLVLLSIFLTPFLFSAMANAEGPSGGNFEENKAKILANLDERMGKLQEHKACVSAAADKDAMKACREKMKGWREMEKEERMAKRKERMDKRMKKMESKHKNMDTQE